MNDTISKLKNFFLSISITVIAILSIYILSLFAAVGGNQIIIQPAEASSSLAELGKMFLLIIINGSSSFLSIYVIWNFFKEFCILFSEEIQVGFKLAGRIRINLIKETVEDNHE